MAVDFQQLTNKVEILSPLPEVWDPVVERALSGTLQPALLLKWLERDVALAARILAVANSERYGKPEQIATLPDALQYLGLDMVQNLVLSSPCDIEERRALYGQRLAYLDFWKHSLACSILSGLIAERVAPGSVEEAKLAGLLHDLGKILLNLQEPEAARQIIPERGRKALCLQEEEILGCMHADAGQIALETLLLPKVYPIACGRHHLEWEQLNLGWEPDLIAACVSLADHLAYQLELGDGGNHARLMESPPDGSRIQLSASALDALKNQARERFEEVVGEVRPGTLHIRRQFQLVRRATLTLGQRSLYLNKNVTELSRLQEIHEDLNRSLGLHELLEQIALRLGTIFSAEVIVFLLLLDERPQIRFFSKIPIAEPFMKKCRKYLLEGLPQRKEKAREKIQCESRLLVPDATSGRIQLTAVRSSLRLSLQGREGPIGRLGFFSSMAGVFTQADENLAAIIAGEIALALDRANWMRRTEILSITDELTGLYNHRRFLEILEHEFGRSRRYKLPLCLLMLDIDHFKLLNDTYGHQQGDRMLRALAKILRQETRESDMSTRYGGEEFAIVLPSTDLTGGKITAERIRKAVESYAFPCPENPSLHMTVSLGVAHYEGEGITESSQLVEYADTALYQAKAEGRNRSVVYGG